jgi:ammonia channel protein AmtB
MNSFYHFFCGNRIMDPGNMKYRIALIDHWQGLAAHENAGLSGLHIGICFAKRIGNGSQAILEIDLHPIM